MSTWWCRIITPRVFSHSVTSIGRWSTWKIGDFYGLKRPQQWVRFSFARGLKCVYCDLLSVVGQFFSFPSGALENTVRILMLCQFHFIPPPPPLSFPAFLASLRFSSHVISQSFIIFFLLQLLRHPRSPPLIICIPQLFLLDIRTLVQLVRTHCLPFKIPCSLRADQNANNKQPNTRIDDKAMSSKWPLRLLGYLPSRSQANFSLHFDLRRYFAKWTFCKMAWWHSSFYLAR